MLCKYPVNGYRKLSGASGSVRAARYFREGMLALPYGWFGYALYQHTMSCKYPVNGYHKFDGASGSVRAARYFREGMWGC